MKTATAPARQQQSTQHPPLGLYHYVGQDPLGKVDATGRSAGGGTQGPPPWVLPPATVVVVGPNRVRRVGQTGSPGSVVSSVPGGPGVGGTTVTGDSGAGASGGYYLAFAWTALSVTNCSCFPQRPCVIIGKIAFDIDTMDPTADEWGDWHTDNSGSDAPPKWSQSPDGPIVDFDGKPIDQSPGSTGVSTGFVDVDVSISCNQSTMISVSAESPKDPSVSISTTITITCGGCEEDR